VRKVRKKKKKLGPCSGRQLWGRGKRDREFASRLELQPMIDKPVRVINLY
jgi:hypothetical protein